MFIQPNDVVLFQGDSITDTGRDKTQQLPNDGGGIGGGYTRFVIAKLLAERPGDKLTCYNRGISGNRVVDLYARWKIDALNLKPNVISILIGVNETWHEFNWQNGVEVPRYERIYRELLTWTRTERPDVRLVLCEPFYLRCGVVTDEWHGDIEARQEVVGRLAEEFDAKLVRFQQMFDQASEEAPPEYWAADGVHPTPAGHFRMAQLWLQTVNA